MSSYYTSFSSWGHGGNARRCCCFQSLVGGSNPSLYGRDRRIQPCVDPTRGVVDKHPRDNPHLTFGELLRSSHPQIATLRASGDAYVR